MKVFLSWSGSLSWKVACVFRDWLPGVIQSVRPYVSSEDIDKGARWSSDIAQELKESSFGIVCVTRDNLEAPWVNFEAGALSKAFDKSKVCPFLFNIERSDLQGPLLQFQSAVYDKEDVERLLVSINKSLPEDERLEEVRLKKSFDIWWPELKQQLDDLQKEEGSVLQPKRMPDRDALRAALAERRLWREGSHQEKAKTDPVRSSAAEQGLAQESSLFLHAKELAGLSPIEDVISESEDLLMAGVALGFAAQRHRAQLQKQIEKGARLRFMVLDPNSPDIDAIAEMFEVPPNQIREDIQVTLRDLDVLKRKAESIKSGSVEVRLLRREPPFSFLVSNPKSPDGHFSAGLRLHGHRSTTRPSFLLKPSDRWFRFFIDSCENLWADSASWPRSSETTKSIMQRAGVVAYRAADGRLEILLITARTNPKKWIFPVGTVDDGETLQETAARECAEESGYSVEVGRKLGMIESDDGESINRMIFFIARVTGETADYETDRQRRWVQVAELTQIIAEDFKPIAYAALKKLSGQI